MKYLNLDILVTDIQNIIKTNKDLFLGKIIFDSLVKTKPSKSSIYQHFFGVEIETKKEVFNNKILDLMNFDCKQDNGLHFFYILPFTNKKALIETTWYSNKIKTRREYQDEIQTYLKLHNIEGKITFTEFGVIPLNFQNTNYATNIRVPIGTAGNLTRLSTGYTFQAIQTFSQSLALSLKQYKKIIIPSARPKKYNFLDEILLHVIRNNPKRMPSIFFNLFKKNNPKTIINFLTDRSNFIEDIKIISTMPIILFTKTLFQYVLRWKK